MDIDGLGIIVKEVQNDVREVRDKAEKNTGNITSLTELYKNLKTVNDLIPLLIKWVFFPLVLSVGASEGVSRVMAIWTGGN